MALRHIANVPFWFTDSIIKKKKKPQRTREKKTRWFNLGAHDAEAWSERGGVTDTKTETPHTLDRCSGNQTDIWSAWSGLAADNLDHPCSPSGSLALMSLPVHNVSTEYVRCSLGPPVIESRGYRWRWRWPGEIKSAYERAKSTDNEAGCESLFVSRSLRLWLSSIENNLPPSSCQRHDLSFTTATNMTDVCDGYDAEHAEHKESRLLTNDYSF